MFCEVALSLLSSHWSSVDHSGVHAQRSPTCGIGVRGYTIVSKYFGLAIVLTNRVLVEILTRFGVSLRNYITFFFLMNVTIYNLCYLNSTTIYCYLGLLTYSICYIYIYIYIHTRWHFTFSRNNCEAWSNRTRSTIY